MSLPQRPQQVVERVVLSAGLDVCLPVPGGRWPATAAWRAYVEGSHCQPCSAAPALQVGSRVVVQRSDFDQWAAQHRRVGVDLEEPRPAPSSSIQSLMDLPAQPRELRNLEVRALLARMLTDGATFTIIQVDGEEWDLVWFGSTATVTDKVRAEVARLKREIIRLFLGGHAQARQARGRP